MKRFTLFLAAALTVTGVFAQTATAPATTTASNSTSDSTTAAANIGAADPSKIGADQANPQLKEISVSKFEDDGFWTGYMMRDDGFITLRKFEGSPAAKKPIQGETDSQISEPDKYVLGVKIEHLHRAVTSFSISPSRPIAIPGVVKTISVWVVGRNVKHELYAILADAKGNDVKVPMGDLAFTGWKKLTGVIPPSVVQVNGRAEAKAGLTLKSLVIETDPAETYGSYYIYFDDMRAVSDLFIENNRDPDDMDDSVW